MNTEGWKATGNVMCDNDGTQKICMVSPCGKFVEWVPKHRYHTAEIPKGVAGEFSKIEEEFLEAKDALTQGNPLLLLVELSDLVGAMMLYMQTHYPEIGFGGLTKQATLTNYVREAR